MGHQRMAPDKLQHIIRQGGGNVYAPGPQSIIYTLWGRSRERERDERRLDQKRTRKRSGRRGREKNSFKSGLKLSSPD